MSTKVALIVQMAIKKKNRIQEIQRYMVERLTGCAGHRADKLDGIDQAVFVGVEEVEKSG